MIIDGNILTAEDGMVLTNDETYSTRVYLGIHDSSDNWQEIPESEIPEEGDSEADPDEATAEDYEAALGRLGVDV